MVATTDLLVLLAAIPVAALGVLTLLLMLPRAGALSRQRGLALLAAYAAFVVVTVSLPL